jgi:hypothetical protein
MKNNRMIILNIKGKKKKYENNKEKYCEYFIRLFKNIQQLEIF